MNGIEQESEWSNTAECRAIGPSLVAQLWIVDGLHSNLEFVKKKELYNQLLYGYGHYNATRGRLHHSQYPRCPQMHTKNVRIKGCTTQTYAARQIKSMTLD